MTVLRQWLLEKNTDYLINVFIFTNFDRRKAAALKLRGVAILNEKITLNVIFLHKGLSTNP